MNNYLSEVHYCIADVERFGKGPLRSSGRFI